MTTPAMVIVGAGHVGGRAAHALREFGWTGPIVLIGDEPHVPYERPPLSKGLLTGAQSPQDCRLAGPEVDGMPPVQRLVARVETIDPVAREVVLAETSTGAITGEGPLAGEGAGHRVAYASLLLATGGTPRRLQVPGADHPDLLGLRTLDDAARLAPRLVPGAHLLIVGGGFIGLEVAAAARERGCRVTVLEGGARLVGRAVPAAVADALLALHQRNGVDVRLGTVPVRFEAQPLGQQWVTLSDGVKLVADTVVVGIGIEPHTGLARRAGLKVDRGIGVDAALATSAPGIWAAGDVAEFPSPISGQPIRQETWQNAEGQARVAAANMLGGQERFTQLPWFWSDQYDHQLQVSGEPALGVSTVTRGLGGEGRIDFHLDDQGALVGASGFGLAAGVARELKLARWLVERRVSPPPESLADPAVKLKSLG